MSDREQKADAPLEPVEANTPKDLPRGVLHILAPNPSLMTGPGTNSFIVTSATGGCAVIDPGPEIATHLDALADLAATHGGAQAILITHGHPDHMEGAAGLRERTGAPILAWSRVGTPVADQTLQDDELLELGERTLRVVHTPGHRFDHVCFLLEDARALFAGDLVAGVGTVVIAPPEGDLLDYMTSLRRLLALDLNVILPAHGPEIAAPRALLAQYLAHREERERQALNALAAGPMTIPNLVARIYTDVDPQLHPVAALSVEAHLLKLEREGRVAREGESASAAIWRVS
jgi:glyoxylase-like metal-dependent hydrolase (beta-lactamase superfamily II)